MFKNKQHSHYIVMMTYVDSDLYTSEHIAAVCHSADEAKKRFQAVVRDEKQTISDEMGNYTIRITSDTDSLFRYTCANPYDASKFYSIVRIYIREVT